MKVMQVTFVSKNKKCVSIKPIRYLINTEDSVIALEEAEALLEKEAKKGLYVALPVIPKTLHEIYNDNNI